MGTQFWFILNFTGLVHCDHIICKANHKEHFGRYALQHHGIFLWELFEFPNNCLVGKLKSHSLVHCKSTGHVLHWGYCREIGLEYSECTYNRPVRYVSSSLSQYSQCVTAWYITLCPQWNGVPLNRITPCTNRNFSH